MIIVERQTRSGKRFVVAVVDGQAVATLDDREIGRGASQVGWRMLRPSGGHTHAAGVPGKVVVGMTEAEAKRLGEVLHAEDMKESAKAREYNQLYNEGGDGYNPYDR